MGVSPILLHDQIYSLPASRHTRQKITRPLCSSPFSPSSSIGSSTPSSEYSSPLSPNSPLNFYGVPFKWEQQPGIPKHSPPLKNQLIKLSPWDPLPLPPAGPPPRSMSPFIRWKQKFHGHAKLGRDPFMAALVACSRPDHEYNWKGSSRVTRALSDRFGSCKSVSCVVESTVVIPRSKYEMLNRRMG